MSEDIEWWNIMMKINHAKLRVKCTYHRTQPVLSFYVQHTQSQAPVLPTVRHEIGEGHLSVWKLMLY